MARLAALSSFYRYALSAGLIPGNQVELVKHAYGVPNLTADSGGLGTTQNLYTFKAGITHSVTGWVKYGQRWYNPTHGRWTQQDTLDTALNPANANRYAYAANDPINNSARDTQLEVLRGLGCHTAQGYLISRPLPPHELDQAQDIPDKVHSGRKTVSQR